MLVIQQLHKALEASDINLSKPGRPLKPSAMAKPHSI